MKKIFFDEVWLTERILFKGYRIELKAYFRKTSQEHK